MNKLITTPWDPAGHLETGADMVAYLEAAFEDGDPALIAAALGDIARAKGMTQVARETRPGRKVSTRLFPPRAIRSSPPSSRWFWLWA